MGAMTKLMCLAAMYWYMLEMAPRMLLAVAVATTAAAVELETDRASVLGAQEVVLVT